MTPPTRLNKTKRKQGSGTWKMSKKHEKRVLAEGGRSSQLAAGRGPGGMVANDKYIPMSGQR